MKIRGFERISEKQYVEDFKDIVKVRTLEEYWNYNEIQTPKRSTAKSAGNDVFCSVDLWLLPNEEFKIPTGIKAYMLDDEVLKAYPRSSLGFKYYLRFANTIPIIDADYYNNKNNEGHIWIKVRNEGDKTLHVEKGEAICQFIFEKYLLADGDSYEGEERIGGIGSTNK